MNPHPPKHVKVGPYWFAVESDDGLRMDTEDGSTTSGYVDTNNLKIVVNTARPEQIQRSVLVHELMHVVLQNAGIEHDEQVIVALETGWLAVLQDNPALIDYLMGREHDTCASHSPQGRVEGD